MRLRPKSKQALRVLKLTGVAFLTLPLVSEAQFTYSTNNGSITITGYSGPGGNAVIPDTINGLPVTAIGEDAFSVSPNLTGLVIPNSVSSIGNAAFMNCGLTNITIPGSVTNIGNYAFAAASSLTNIFVDPTNPAYHSYTGVLFDQSQSGLIQYPGGRSGSYVIPASVTHIANAAFYNCFGLQGVSLPPSLSGIGDFAFNGCTNLTNVQIGNGVTGIGAAAFSQCSGLTNLTLGTSVQSIGDSAFYGCFGLTTLVLPSSLARIGQQAFDSCFNLWGFYFLGDAPALGPLPFASDLATAYYLPGTAGWGSNLGELPTAPWVLAYPLILNTSSSLGVQSNQFSFVVSWAANAPVVIEASPSLAHPVWTPLQTNDLSSGWFNFSDPGWNNYPARFYRVRSQ